MTSLFDETKLGGVTLANRMVMAPLTRNRADPEGVCGALAATYYGQRASAGLIISEGIQPSALAQGFFGTPGLHEEDQITAWREVTDRVHAYGGVIYAQLMHAGRIGHPELRRHSSIPAGLLPMAPSAILPKGICKTYDGPRELLTPREMTAADIATTISDFATGAANAIKAGFDGVELHGASGVLLHQFLADGSNQRTDRYGGSTANRMRFVVEVTEAVAEAIGPDRVGVRFSPSSTFGDISQSDIDQLYPALTRELAVLGISFLHIYECCDRPLTQRLRALWPATFVVNPHVDDRRAPSSLAAAEQLLAEDLADLVAFGRLFVSNPDLPRRFRDGLPLAEFDPDTFYGGGHHGYTDYPAYALAERTPR
ncbi:MAG TPA: alkene reductase [Pseudonocardiaceae bacterium]|nr:alkene reductase [Pseudonocardiaceae bacterium]